MNPEKKEYKDQNEKPQKFSNDDYSKFAESSTFDEASYYEDSEASIGGTPIEGLDAETHNVFGAKAGHDHSTGGDKVPIVIRNDANLEEEARILLSRSPLLKASIVVISVDAGTILLSGRVQDQMEKQEIEKCLRPIDGVVRIVNQLQVRS